MSQNCETHITEKEIYQLWLLYSSTDGEMYCAPRFTKQERSFSENTVFIRPPVTH